LKRENVRLCRRDIQSQHEQPRLATLRALPLVRRDLSLESRWRLSPATALRGDTVTAGRRFRRRVGSRMAHKLCPYTYRARHRSVIWLCALRDGNTCNCIIRGERCGPRKLISHFLSVPYRRPKHHRSASPTLAMPRHSWASRQPLDPA